MVRSKTGPTTWFVIQIRYQYVSSPFPTAIEKEFKSKEFHEAWECTNSFGGYFFKTPNGDYWSSSKPNFEHWPKLEHYVDMLEESEAAL